MGAVNQESIDDVREVNQLVEWVLNDRIGRLERRFEGDVITFIGPLEIETDDHVRDVVESMDRGASRRRVVMLLTSEGGFIEVVHRMAETLRHYYEKVEFVVPNYAYSAGTVLVLSGDKVHMDYYSRLGPIDPQIVSGENLHPVPALGYVEQYEKFVVKADEEELNEAELEFFLEKFDPGVLELYEQERERAIGLLKKWLPRYMFKESGGSVKKKETRADKIGELLSDTDRWHTHNHGISMSVLRDELGLGVEDFGLDEVLSNAIRSYHQLITDYLVNLGGQGIIHIKGELKHF